MVSTATQSRGKTVCPYTDREGKTISGFSWNRFCWKARHNIVYKKEHEKNKELIYKDLVIGRQTFPPRIFSPSRKRTFTMLMRQVFIIMAILGHCLKGDELDGGKITKDKNISASV